MTALSHHHRRRLFLAAILILSLSVQFSGCLSGSVKPRRLAVVPTAPVVLNYHNGPLLKGSFNVTLIWYGAFTSSQRSIVSEFVSSLSSAAAASPSVAGWWSTTSKYKQLHQKHRTAATKLAVVDHVLDSGYSLGKRLSRGQITELAGKGGQRYSINVVLTASDVVVDGFCMNECGFHGTARGTSGGKFAYIWVGNSVSQCPGECAWPFHQPLFGPQTPPLIPPNGDVGVDGMIINLATLLAGTVTNPFDNGYFQGPASAPLEAVSACTGIFGKGAFPGYPGNLIVDKTTGASYNAHGVGSRKYLLPAMWDPATSLCTPLV